MLALPVQYINPFFASVKRVCGETIKIPVTSGTPSIRHGDDRLWKLYPLSAAINLSSAVQGSVAISFAQPVALALASGLAQTTFVEFDDGAKDALGEVANLIIGSAKKEMPGGLVTISTPTIIQTHELELPRGLPVLLLPFDAGCGRFIMQMALAIANANTPGLALEPAPSAAAKAA